MSAIFKTQGGSGGFFPSIFVRGLSETDTVYAAKDGKTVQGKWDSGRNGFIFYPLREFGMWAVTATNGVKTKTQDVLVDVAAEYEITINLANYLMLYDQGDECEDVTGGWGSSVYSGGNSVTKNDNRITLNSAAYGASAFTKSVIPSGYSRVNSIFDVMATNINESNTYIALSTTISAWQQTWNGMGSDVKRYLCAAKNTTYKAALSIPVTNGKYAVITAYCPCVVNLHAYFLTETDDWQTLCTTAGISTPADLATLIANTTSIAAILANEDAVKYMVAACTGDFMALFVESSACLSALNASPYKSIVTANYHWAKFLAMVQ